VATDNGVGRWDGQRWTAYTTAAGLPSNDVLGVSSGQQHTVWAATAAGGAYFDGSTWRAFTRQDGLPEGDLKGVMAWSDQVWFSTRGSGLLVLMIEPPAP
jgi:ligand-binding sensor domain-containing protein